jgi:FkbM family methyltransferase
LNKILWVAKNRAARIPGLYGAFRWVTTKAGEGRVYPIIWGPMKGFRWRRHNSLTFWYHLGMWEPHVSELIARHLRPGDVFWDVGANAGYHSLLGARTVGPNGAVVAFEPDPRACEIIRDQLSLNGISNCTIEEAAVADRPGSVVLRRLPNCLMSTLDGIVEGGEPLDVRATTMDSMLETSPPPNLIKMDIEGAEVLALQGGERLFATHRPRLLLSLHGDKAATYCTDLMRRHGYSLEVIDGFEQMLVALPE